MSLPASENSNEEHGNEPVASTRRAADPRRVRARSCRVGLVVVTLLGTGVLAAACGGVPSVEQVVGFPHPTLAFVHCMRTHGEPNMPDPVVHGNSVRISIKVGSGVEPGSPQFTAAFHACKYLTSPSAGLPYRGRSPSAS